jgi:signal transduction histidine kinase
MNEQTLQADENLRVAALKSYSILETQPEKDFDDLAELASQICQVPISAITLMDIDRQWFKSKIGFDNIDVPRQDAFCTYMMDNGLKSIEIQNMNEHYYFANNRYVVGNPKISFYAGVLLIDPNGHTLGSLCVYDTEPKKLTHFQLSALEKLANQVIQLLELRKKNELLEKNNAGLLSKYNELEQFARVVSHDIKSPLNNIISLTHLFQDEYGKQIDDAGNEYLEYISTASLELKNFVDAILVYYKSDTINTTEKEAIDWNSLFNKIISILDSKNEYDIIFPKNSSLSFHSNKMAIEQILSNLISNSIKYNDKEKVKVEIELIDLPTEILLSIKDNGIGIAKTDYEKVFSFFTTLGKRDRFNNNGTGIGLSTVQNMVQKLDGRIELESEIGLGSSFKLYFKK